MRNFQSFRFVLMLAALLPLAASQTAPPQPQDLPVGSAVVTQIKGDVVFTSPEGSPVTPQRGSTLAPETKIETAKGSVLLELQDGSQVLVNAHSNVVLKAPNQGKGYYLELLIGKIMAKVQKRLGSAPSFKMGTPSAVITVRGTRFEVEVNKKRKTYVNVFEGVVEVSGATVGSPSVIIRPGFYTGVDEDRPPQQPRESNPEGSGREDGRQGPGAERERPENQPNQPRSPQNEGGGKPD